MCKPYVEATVIPRRFYKHKQNNRTASLYGACPWTSADDEKNWELVTKGYSLSCIDHRGTHTVRGLQYAPYTLETPEEALAHAEKIALKAIPLRAA